MRKLLILMLVFGLTSVASATIVDLRIDPLLPGGSAATRLNPSEVARVYVTVDTTGLPGTALNLGNLDAVISVAGPGTIVGAIGLGDLPPGATMGIGYGAEVIEFVPGAAYMYTGGWQGALSFMPILLPASAEIGMGQMGSQIYDTTYEPMALQPADPLHMMMPWYNGAVGYVDIHCNGIGLITVSIADGFSFGAAGSMMDDGVTKPAFGAGTVVYNIPEPATMALLGLGSLFLLRRRRK